MNKQWKPNLKKLLPHYVGLTEYELILDTLAEILYNNLSQQDHKSYNKKKLKLQGVRTYGK